MNSQRNQNGSRRGDLLKSGLNRRMEGIGYNMTAGSDPFSTNNFELNNVKH